MARQIFVNLPVKNVAKTREFFGKLGFGFNEQFSNETAICMIVSDASFVMLLHEDFFKTFTKKPIADATKTTEVLVCLSCESRAEVDRMVADALAAGGTAPNPTQDMGFMYSHGFTDLDGHVWELVFMDPNAAPPH